MLQTMLRPTFYITFHSLAASAPAHHHQQSRSNSGSATLHTCSPAPVPRTRSQPAEAVHQNMYDGRQISHIPAVLQKHQRPASRVAVLHPSRRHRHRRRRHARLAEDST